jgi:UPF0755 protein
MSARNAGHAGNRALYDKRRRKRRWPTRIAVVGGFLVFITIVGFLATKGVDWFNARTDATTSTTAGHGPVVKVIVNPGMSATEIGRLLEQKGVINSAADFVDLVKTRDTENDLRPGNYEFYEDQKLLEVVDMLEKGSSTANLKETIREGLSVSQIAAQLNKEGVMSGDAYVELAGKPKEFVLPNVGGKQPDVDTLEGLLFPSTYFLMEGDGATELIGAQLAAFTAKTANLPWKNAAALGVTPMEIVVIASLIEKEVSVASERAKVAAVIYNRLKADMTLGIDATVRYAVNKWTGALTAEDLNVDSPYNTRIKKGLPPTPICNPGVAALQAALEPAKVDYLYYVLEDNDGNHFFTASYDEFLQAKQNAPQ